MSRVTRTWMRTACTVAAMALVAAPAARAQGVEALGTRALGMGGAFVAVADDATATYWNPAGLATGPLFSSVFAWQTDQTGHKNAPPTGGPLQEAFQDGSSAILAVSTPPLGFTYYQVRFTHLQPARHGGPADDPIGLASSLTTHQTGVTLVQSLTQYLHVGATLKYVRARAIVTDRLFGEDDEDEVERVDDLPGITSSKFDLDLGAMAVVGRARVGLVVRNLTQPEFDATADGRVTLPLQRQARAGVAFQATDSTMISADVDLTRTDTELGVRRHVAVGGEHWWFARRFGLRGGFRVNTVDDADPVASAGVSVGLTPSVSVDSFVTRGASQSDRAWGVSGRLAF
jgi:F plasmid transfer operon, TraF, protein